MARKAKGLSAPETLRIKSFGPIEDLTIEPRPLTIFIGEQASGKSLVAQVLYFFRNLKNLMSRAYSPESVSEEKWQRKIIKELLDDLRAVPFALFSNGTAHLTYQKDDIDWKISISGSKRNLSLNRKLEMAMEQWISEWAENKSELGKEWATNQIFIPTERSLYSRLWGQAQSILFAEHQPQPFRHFAEHLSRSHSVYQKLYHEPSSLERIFHVKHPERLVRFIQDCQKRALDGEVYVQRQGPRIWEWKIDKGDGKEKVIPMEAISSGQMEAWPFFIIAATFGGFTKAVDIYFEEPETHLHPQAQIEIMRAIGHLVNQGQRFVITTHSPFLMYVVNNMIQRHVTYNGDVPEGEDIALNPDHVAAYRLGKKTENITDDEESRLLDLEELEAPADELGGEFDRLLYMTDAAD